MKNGKVKISIALIACIIMLLLVAGTGICAAKALYSDTFYRGISIGGIRVDGMKKDEALNVISASFNESRNKSGINLLYNGKRWFLSFNALSLAISPERTVEEGYNAGRTGNIFKRLSEILSLRINPKNFIVDFHYDKNKLKQILTNVKKEIDRAPENAKVLYWEGQLVKEKESKGHSLDIGKNMQLVDAAINARTTEEIELGVDETEPEITYDNIKDFDGVLSEFSTSFNLADENRSSNIKKACAKINGILLPPGKIFSMNKALGPRTHANGYKEAPIIFKNELVSGTGGGVCQVTTTLYVSILLAKLGVLERTHHSIPLGYVEPGQDATISGDVIDLKFKNTSQYPVGICSVVENNKILIKILGKTGNKAEVVKLKSVIMGEFTTDEEDVIIDDSMPDNKKEVLQEAKKGLRVVLYRLTFDKDDNIQNKEMISDDIYQPVKARVRANSNYNKVFD